MALLQEWQKIAYNEQADRAKLQKFWQDYFLVEKGIYEKLLDHPDEEVQHEAHDPRGSDPSDESVGAQLLRFLKRRHRRGERGLPTER